jgi:hypothetical protein
MLMMMRRDGTSDGFFNGIIGKNNCVYGRYLPNHDAFKYCIVLKDGR